MQFENLMFRSTTRIVRIAVVVATLLASSCTSTETRKRELMELSYQRGRENAEEEIRRDQLYLLVIGLVSPPDPDPATGLAYRATGCAAYPELSAFVEGFNDQMGSFVRMKKTGSAPTRSGL
jgi:hypothetical protein